MLCNTYGYVCQLGGAVGRYTMHGCFEPVAYRTHQYIHGCCDFCTASVEIKLAVILRTLQLTMASLMRSTSCDVV